MQHIRAMGVNDALRVPRCARRIAHAGGRVLVERLPGEVIVNFADPFFIRNSILERCLRHMGSVGEHDITLDRRQPRRKLLHERHECEVDQHHAILCVIDDPGDLVREKAGIDGVIECPNAEYAVPGLQMAPRVPGQGRNPVTEFYAVLAEPLGYSEGASADCLIGRRMDRPLDRACNDTPVWVVIRRVVDDTMAEQWPVLHQSKHERSPLYCCVCGLAQSDLSDYAGRQNNTNNLLQRCGRREGFFGCASTLAISDFAWVWSTPFRCSQFLQTACPLCGLAGGAARPA